ncbi:MAG TPA: enoyl-CoA hydratase/isomerase family protein, partial [Devosia sp.]|nr:enoyl-CoA hydratase/isomerase family protein [Devosia sp.]
LGLADAAVRPDRVERLRADIAEAARSARAREHIARLVLAESVVAGEAAFTAKADLLPTEPWEDPATFLRAVEAVPELSEIAALLRDRSPSALAATFHAQLAARRSMSVDTTLASDLRLARLMVRWPDFAEGVRAVLVDKDQAPRWSPDSLDALDPEPILAAVAEPDGGLLSSS